MSAGRWIAHLQTLSMVTALAALPVTTMTYFDEVAPPGSQSHGAPPARGSELPARSRTTPAAFGRALCVSLARRFPVGGAEQRQGFGDREAGLRATTARSQYSEDLKLTNGSRRAWPSGTERKPEQSM